MFVPPMSKESPVFLQASSSYSSIDQKGSGSFPDPGLVPCKPIINPFRQTVLLNQPASLESRHSSQQQSDVRCQYQAQ